MLETDTIAAIATAKGTGGVGIIRVSGPLAKACGLVVTGKILTARNAQLCNFYAADKSIIDNGIAIFYKAPNTFTGEPVLELQGHGGVIVMQLLLKRVLSLGIRLAQPGEFSKRAFLNNKIDLLQAESVSELIAAKTDYAAKVAARSLSGDFSKNINMFQEKLHSCRMQVEASIDFPEEELGLYLKKIIDSLNFVCAAINSTLKQAKNSEILSEGIKTAIIGPPNAGKSSLLNRLAGKEKAIVTDIPGTTRDTKEVAVNIDNVTLTLVDTAGIRLSEDVIEQEGIKRAWEEVSTADLVLLVVDGVGYQNEKNLSPYILFPEWMQRLSKDVKVIFVVNKVDKTAWQPQSNKHDKYQEVFLSAQKGYGIELLQKLILDMFSVKDEESMFVARARHVESLKKSAFHIEKAKLQLEEQFYLELAAEELRLAQIELGGLTGEFCADDLLGKIFSEFCIGK